MNRNKFYLLLIIALAISNILMLFLHFAPPPRHRNPGEIIIERLKFDEQQIEKYNVLVDEHREMTVRYEDQVNQLRNSIYQQLNQPKDSLKVDSLTKQMAVLHQRAELMNYKHFDAIKKICKPEQLPLFEKLVGEFTRLFSDRRPPRRK